MPTARQAAAARLPRPARARACRDPRQKWQLAQAAFEHCQLVIGALETSPPLSQDVLARPPPGLVVCESVLSGGAALQAILHVLGHGEEELRVGGVMGWALRGQGPGLSS